MLFFCYLFLSILCPNPKLRAQTLMLVDSLESLLTMDLDTPRRIEILENIAWEARKYQLDRAMEAANEMLMFCIKIEDRPNEAVALNRIGEILRLQERYLEAGAPFLKALKIERETQHAYGIARALGQLTQVYRGLGRLDSALLMGKQSLEVYQQLKRPLNIARTHQRLFAIYMDMGLTDSAALELKKKLPLSDSLNRPFMKAVTAQSFGELAEETGSLDLALQNYLEASGILRETRDSTRISENMINIGNIYWSLGDLELAEEYYQQAIDQYPGDTDGPFRAVINLGLIGENKKQYPRAIQFYRKGLQVAIDNGSQPDVFQTLLNLGNVFAATDQLDSALHYYQKASGDTLQSITQAVDVNRCLAELYKRTGQDSLSLKYFNLHLKLRDSLDHILLETVRLKDNLEVSQQQAELLQKDLQQEQTASEKKLAIIYALSVSFFSLLMLFFLLLRSRRLQEKKLLAEKNAKIYQQEKLVAEKNAKIFKQKVDDVLRSAELREMDAMHTAQQAEKQRIARELHDKLGGTLSTVKLYFESIEEHIASFQEKNRGRFNKAIALLNDACEDVRSIAYKMGQDVLMEFGLGRALENLDASIGEITELTISITHHGIEEQRLPYEYEINIYRIIQELISNAVKHSEAEELTAQLIRRGDIINLTVEDDGRGFDPDNREKFGMGIKNIETRVKMLSGNIQIDSGRGSGSTFIIEIPLKQKPQS